MIRVREQKPRAALFQARHGLALDGRLGRHGHEDRRLNSAMRGLKCPSARLRSGRGLFQHEVQTAAVRAGIVFHKKLTQVRRAERW